MHIGRPICILMLARTNMHIGGDQCRYSPSRSRRARAEKLRAMALPTIDEEAYSSHKEAFDAAVEKHLGGQAANSPVLTEEQHDKILSGMIA